jgi:hypothetical protein
MSLAPPPAGGYLPQKVRERADLLREQLGVEPEVIQVDRWWWRLTLAGARVQVVCEWKYMAGRSRAYRTVLMLDGKEVPRVGNPAAFVKFWRAHEPGAAPDSPAEDDRAESRPAEPIPMPAPRAPEEAPYLARSLYDRFAEAARGKDGVTWALGFDGQRWLVGLDFQGRSLRFPLVRRKRTWELDHEATQLIIDGVDKSGAVKGKLDEALALIFASSRPPAGQGAAPAGVSGPAAAKANNAVTVRSTVVRRE